MGEAMVGWLGGDGGWMGTAGDALLLLRRRLGCGVGGGDGRYCHGRSIFCQSSSAYLSTPEQILSVSIQKMISHQFCSLFRMLLHSSNHVCSAFEEAEDFPQLIAFITIIIAIKV